MASQVCPEFNISDKPVFDKMTEFIKKTSRTHQSFPLVEYYTAPISVEKAK